MAKIITIGDLEKKDIKQTVIAAKEQIQDNLKPVSNGGNWPDLSSLPAEAETAFSLLRQNQILVAKGLFFALKKLEELEQFTRGQP